MANSSRGDIEPLLLKARIQLALDQPFLASAVLRLPFRECAQVSWCKTMATDGYHIFYNPKWVVGLSQGELRGVLAHEVLHVVFAHADRMASRVPSRWNLAADISINLLLLEQGFRLPLGGAVDLKFVGMPAEVVYERLLGMCISGQSARKKKREKTGDDDTCPGWVVSPESDLLDPCDPRVAPLQSSDMPDREQRRELTTSLRAEVAKHLKGRAAASLHQDLTAAVEAQVDWRALLRQWLQDRIKHGWGCPPFSKRHIHRGLYLPSPSIEAPGHVVFAIDTSGSMSEAQIADILAEVKAFRQAFPSKMTIVQADDAVRSVQSYEAVDGMEVPERMQVIGRGGTDFRPVFEWIQAQTEDAPTALIYATDGYGKFPEAEPCWPTLWLISQGGLESDKVPFGCCVRLR